ncbi:hypothetical protein RB595_006831 [Gaeumannomyces hyphopodioides]
MHYHGIITSLALASLTSGVLTNPASGGQGHSAAVAPGAATTNGSCGKANGFTCAGSSFGDCCSVSGQCGSSISFCGEGCQRNYGSCGSKAVTSFADGAPLERLKNFFKSMGISRHQSPPGAQNGKHHPRNGTHHPRNGTHGARNGTHPRHRGFHKFNGTHAGKPSPKKSVSAQDVEAEVAPRCARSVNGEVSPRCKHDAEGGVAPRDTQTTGTNPRAAPGGAPGRHPPSGGPPSGTPPARPTGTHSPGSPRGGRTGAPPSGIPPAHPTGTNGRKGPIGAGGYHPTPSGTGKPPTRPARPT